ncbi:pyrroline-5-carboxylate reductase [Aquibacillus salsiterrae]|uniref:Pyrroline-5-carboxylate reductase n=1 Tax=Aquibacillus salsiterrae TaxID=2950439 RepID=A0A9X3WC66_9BACI|nr:pyrroline-5-carboxylate reductase [Aquibacillus salsiterrae]MDC3417092.1 pyrroline-5-carboxylate reductase [Aquibacillus salsiterrae]
MENKTIKTLFIGAGRMAQAMISQLVKDTRFEITVTNSGNQKRLTDVKEIYEVSVATAWTDVIEDSDVVVLAIPPDAHPAILGEISPLIKGQLVITVAAGIRPSWLEERLPDKTAVAWVMPNTAAEVGQSSTPTAVGNYVTPAQKEVLEALLSNIGTFEIVTEEQVKALTAITGSAPAFVYKIAQALVETGLKSGITVSQANHLVAQMILGSASMLKTGKSPEELIDQVATPGGSTAEGLRVLDENNTKEIIATAIQACRDKANQSDN